MNILYESLNNYFDKLEEKIKTRTVKNINVSGSYFFSRIQLVDNFYSFTPNSNILYENLTIIFDKNSPNNNYDYRLYYDVFKDKIKVGRYTIYIRNIDVRNPDKTNPTFPYISFKLYVENNEKDLKNSKMIPIEVTQQSSSIEDYVENIKGFEEGALNKLAKYLNSKK